MKLTRQTRRKLLYQISTLVFVLVVIGLFYDIRIAQKMIRVFLYWDTALYTFWAFLFLFLASWLVFIVFKYGKPRLMLYLALIWLGNYFVVMALGYEMPIQILVTFPVAFFGSVFLLSEYCEGIIHQISSS